MAEFDTPYDATPVSVEDAADFVEGVWFDSKAAVYLAEAQALADTRADLYSVQFVMGDRLELWFGGAAGDSPHLLCNVWPCVEISGVSYQYADTGYDDALLRLIPARVLATQEETGMGIKLVFDGASITLHPDRDDVGDEIAMLTGFGDGMWMVRRPGEDSFEDLG